MITSEESVNRRTVRQTVSACGDTVRMYVGRYVDFWNELVGGKRKLAGGSNYNNGNSLHSWDDVQLVPYFVSRYTNIHISTC